MLDFGFSEILLTSAIALVVLGPERLPKVARQVGNWMGARAPWPGNSPNSWNAK